jgi:plastocyanin
LSLVLAVIILVGLALLRFHERMPYGRLPGLVVLTLVFADLAAYTVTGAVSNALSGEALLDLVIPGALAALSSAGLIAAVAAIVRRRDPLAGGYVARGVGLSAVAFFVLVLATGCIAGNGRQLGVQPTDIVLQTEGMKFSNAALNAPEGRVSLRLVNKDLFWHTFTIDGLGVNVQAPVGGEREIVFDAPPGTYEFYCAIPGHRLIGMHGTLTVTAAGQ